MNKNFLKNKLYKSLILAISSLIIVCGIGFFSFDILKEIQNIGNGGEKIISDNEYYTINNKATDLQKEIYKELSKEINENYSRNSTEIAALVTKSFVADYFTWINKNGSYDVGGIEYISNPRINNFIQQSRDEFYKYLSYYISEHDSKEGFPEVETIECNVVNAGITITVNEKEYSDTFYAEVSWTYKPSDVFDLSKFQNNGAAKLYVNEDGRYEIYEFYAVD